MRAVICLTCVECLRRGVGSLRLQLCAEVAVRLTTLMLFHSLYVAWSFAADSTNKFNKAFNRSYHLFQCFSERLKNKAFQITSEMHVLHLRIYHHMQKPIANVDDANIRSSTIIMVLSAMAINQPGVSLAARSMQWRSLGNSSPGHLFDLHPLCPRSK